MLVGCVKRPIDSGSCVKIAKAKDRVQFYIKFNSESFLICFADSLGCPF